MKYNFGLIGNHISYSQSPVIHQKLGKLINEDIEYKILDIEEHQLGIYIDKLKSGEFQGFNVTKPYKECFFDYLDELSEVAKDIQAINTIYIKDGKIIGDNTDVYGFEYLLDVNQIDVENKRVLILGTGGASKAVAYVLKNKGAKYQYASRIKDKKRDQKVISYDEINPYDFDIYINTTPVGTYPDIKSSPLHRDKISNQIVIDLIYNPKITEFMSYANQSVNGLMMLIAQAIQSESLWLKKEIKIVDVLEQIKEVISYE